MIALLLVIAISGAAAAGLSFIYELNTITFFKAFVCTSAFNVIIWLGFINDKYRAMSKKAKDEKGRPTRSKNNELGSGDLANEEHVKRWITKNNELDTCLPVEGLKGSEGLILKKGELIISADERNRHMLIIAKTGSGKTTKLILPVLYHDCLCKHRSTIVIDSKPEMWDKLAAFTRKNNPEKKILLFNPLDTLRSLSWNILAKVEDDTDAKLIANTIITATDNPSSKQDSPFFRNNALQLLNGIMVGLLNDDDEVMSMPRIHEIIHSGMQNLCDWLEAHPEALRNTRTFVELARSGSQNADTIMSELGMRLAAWDLKAIRSTTFYDELDMETLISDPTLFIVEFRESELEMLRPMANVIVVELLRFLTKRAEQCPGNKLPRPVSLVIDEFASALGRLPDIHVKLNTLRSRNVSIVAAIQSIAQVKANYDKDADSVLAGFSTKILMPALDFQDAEWASKETGTMTVRYTTESSGKNKRMVDYFAHQNQNLNEQIQQRAVLTPDEIGRPVDNATTFFMPNTPVFQGHLIPFYKIPAMLEAFESADGEVVMLRDGPIVLEEKLPEPMPKQEQNNNSNGQMRVNPKQVSTAQMSPDQIANSLEQIKLGLDWENTTGAAKQWWQAFEQANQTNLVAVLSLAQEIGTRKSTIAQFYDAFVKSGTDDLKQVLVVLDQKLVEERKSTLLDWASASGPAREWWMAFEKANAGNDAMIHQLVIELMNRKATIGDFFNVYVNGSFKSVPDVLNALDKALADGTVAKYREQASAAPASQKKSVVGTPPPASAPQRTSVTPAAAKNTSQEKVAPVAEKTPLQENVVQEKQGVRPSGADCAKSAVANVQLQSYLQMAEQFLKAGSINDYKALIGLAQDDNSFSEADIAQLKALAEGFGAEA